MRSLRYYWKLSPVTVVLVGVNLLSFLVLFFMQVRPTAVPVWLVEDLLSPFQLTKPWLALIFWMLTPVGPVFLLFLLYFLFRVGYVLELQWGSRKFATFMGASCLLSWLSVSLGNHLLGSEGGRPGVLYPWDTMLVVYTVLFAGESLCFWFICMPARVFRYLILALVYLLTGPILGLFALIPPLLAWGYALMCPGRQLWPGYKSSRARSEGRGGFFARLKRDKVKRSLTALPGGRVAPLEPAQRTRAAVSRMEQEIDRILDKVRVEGLGALTTEERATLDSHSVQLRTRDNP